MLHAGQTDLMSIVVHGDPAALAHGEVDVRHRPVGHFGLFPLAAAQHPRAPHGVLADGLVLH